MREVVGFIQLACALTLGMAGGWAVHQMLGHGMEWFLIYLATLTPLVGVLIGHLLLRHAASGVAQPGSTPAPAEPCHPD